MHYRPRLEREWTIISTRCSIWTSGWSTLTSPLCSKTQQLIQNARRRTHKKARLAHCLEHFGNPTAAAASATGDYTQLYFLLLLCTPYMYCTVYCRSTLHVCITQDVCFIYEQSKANKINNVIYVLMYVQYTDLLYFSHLYNFLLSCQRTGDLQAEGKAVKDFYISSSVTQVDYWYYTTLTKYIRTYNTIVLFVRVYCTLCTISLCICLKNLIIVLVV